MRYTISRAMLLGIGLALLGNFFHVGELHAASSISTFEYAELNNCVIPAGASTCLATLAIYAPSGLTFTVNNLTRGITSSNILTPNNYILYAGGYAYVLNATVLSDSANRLTYGDNDLTIIKSGTDLPSMRAVGNASCATGTTWNGQTCGSSVPPILTGSTTSTVLITTGNRDTSYNFSLPKDISKNFYNPELVTKNINIPNTTSILNIELASTKERCSVSPTYTADNGMSFSSNGKDFIKPDTKSVSHMVPTYSGLANLSSLTVLYGRVSSISISCDNMSAPVKDFIILKITFGTTITPTQPPEIQATSCIIASGKSTCVSTVSMTPAPSKNYNLENSTRGLTTTNAFGQGVSKVSTSTLGEQAANYLTFGSNTLNLKDGTTTVSSVLSSATCASGTTWNGQICAKPAPLSIGCSKASYTVGEEISCRISGGTDPRSCWQTGTKSTTAVECTSVGWVEDGDLYYYTTLTSSAIGKYTLYVKDGAGQTASTTVSYLAPPVLAPTTLKASGCTIASGKSTCISTATVSPTPTKSYSLENSTRGLTMTNAFRQGVSSISSSALGEQASNYLTFGSNTLNLKDGTTTVSSVQATATCASGTVWNGQICMKPETLSISCSKASYSVGDEISCIIKGGSGKRMCWQKGTTTTTAQDCTQVGWALDEHLYYYKILTASMAGKYTLSVKDSLGQTASTNVEYVGENSYYDFITENCTIAAGKNTCVSTFYLVNPASGKSYDVKNVTRNITTKNFFTPNSLGTLPGSNYPAYKVSTAPSTSYANVATFGTSSLVLIDSNGISLKKSSFVASCVSGSVWNGKMCEAKSPPIACTMEARMCEDGSLMPRDTLTCEWLPGQCNPTPATSIILNDFIINDTVFDHTGNTISLTSNDILSFKGASRPGALIYFFREGQSTYDFVKTGVNGEWSFDRIWSPAGGKIVTPGAYTYILSGLPPNSSSAIYSPQVGLRINVANTPGTNPGTVDVTIEAKNCTIAIGKSTCASTISVTSTKYKGTTGGRTFDLKNATRNLTSIGLFSPGNTPLNPDGYPVYTVSESPTGDAANYATNGGNDFMLSEGGVVVAKTYMTASCASGSAWNGKLCAELPPSGQSGGISTPSNTTVKMTNCVIPQGKSTCPATVLIFSQSGKTFTVYNVERDVNSIDILKPKDFRSVSGKTVYILRGTSLKLASNLTYGTNTLYITEKGLENYPITVTGTATCAIGRKWDGTKCISAIPTVFSITGFTTARGEKAQSGGSIVFNPSLDKTLTLQGVGPYGVIEVRESGSTTSLIRSSSTDSTGKWKIMINTSALTSKGITSLIVWDGKNTATQVQVQIYNETFSDPAGTQNGSTISGSSTPLKTTLVDLR